MNPADVTRLEMLPMRTIPDGDLKRLVLHKLSCVDLSREDMAKAARPYIEELERRGDPDARIFPDSL